MKILFEDENIIVLDKPAGLPVLPDGWNKDAPYLVRMLEETYGKAWIVHRLDKVTSGVMLFARTPEAHRSLNMQFERREVEKIYHAIMEGEPNWNEKVAKYPLRANVGKKHRTAVDNRKGKPSETRFRVLKRYQSGALVEAQPMTGRTHQIRVHAYALGHPLLGDLLYDGDETSLIARPALHAYSLTITHPVSNKRLTFKAERPHDFETALELLSL
ncbi:MAG: RluA family pseudouridine synthase [Anaerolineales bacterium]|nr:RluA family pseudouridine synthase [Anaerolineales bacterium]